MNKSNKMLTFYEWNLLESKANYQQYIDTFLLEEKDTSRNRRFEDSLHNFKEEETTVRSSLDIEGLLTAEQLSEYINKHKHGEPHTIPWDKSFESVLGGSPFSNKEKDTARTSLDIEKENDLNNELLDSMLMDEEKAVDKILHKEKDRIELNSKLEKIIHKRAIGISDKGTCILIREILEAIDE